MAANKTFTELEELTTVDKNNDWMAVVDVSDTSASIYGTTKRANVSQFIGDKGGAATVDAGTTTTGDAGTDASVVNVGTTSAAVFNFTIPRGNTGATGADGTDGTDGVNAYVYIAYASDNSGTGFTTIFDANLDYVAIKTTTTEIVTPQASDFTGLWKNYKGATGPAGANGVDGEDGLDINWRGNYASGTAYVINDAVFYSGSSYICKLASTGNLPTNTTYWDLMAQQGAAGAGSGDVSGPASATDNAIARFDLTTGKLIQDSLVTVSDDGDVNIPAGRSYLVNGSPVEGYSDEQAQDAVGTILTDTTTVDFTYTEETPSITADVKDASVANAKLANMATKTYKGRTSATTGVPEDVAVATLKTDLGLVKADVGLGNVDNTSDATKNSATVTLTNKTIDGDTNTISNLAHGAEVDNPTSGVHGVTGSVVGTTDTQTLSDKTLTSPVLNTGVSGTAVLDEDDMASNSATQLATQQSIKAYVDAKGFVWKGPWATSTPYDLNDTVESNGSGYVCTSAHTSGASTEPGVGASWTDKWDLFVEGLPEPNLTTATTTNLTGVITGDGSVLAAKTNPTGAFVGTTDTQTLTNKTLTSPVIDGAGGTGAGVLGYGATDHNLLVGNGTSNLPIHVYHWKAFTPSWTGLTLGTGATNTGSYCQIGKTVHFRVSVTLGTSPSVSGSPPVLTLPVSIVAVGVVYIGSAVYVDEGTQTYVGFIDAYGALRVQGVGGTYPTLASVTSLIPFTWAATDKIYIYGVYEAA